MVLPSNLPYFVPVKNVKLKTYFLRSSSCFLDLFRHEICRRPLLHKKQLIKYGTRKLHDVKINYAHKLHQINQMWVGLSSSEKKE